MRKLGLVAAPERLIVCPFCGEGLAVRHRDVDYDNYSACGRFNCPSCQEMITNGNCDYELPTRDKDAT